MSGNRQSIKSIKNNIAELGESIYMFKILNSLEYDPENENFIKDLKKFRKEDEKKLEKRIQDKKLKKNESRQSEKI